MVVPPGFEPGSPGPKPEMMDHYTTGLRTPLRVQTIVFDGPWSRQYQATSSSRLTVRSRISAIVLLILISAPYSPTVTGHQTPKDQFLEPEFQQESPDLGTPWLDNSLSERVQSGQDKIRVTAITSSIQDLDVWQRKTGSIDRQAPPANGERLVQNDIQTENIEHRTFWMDSELLSKLVDAEGIIALIDAERAPEPYGIAPTGPNPNSVRSGEIHGANDAWGMGFSGDGIIVAVADTGVDFGHPDLNGTQARVEYEGSPYSGWPLMLDHNSMYKWMVDGEAYPAQDSWYADTSMVDFDNDSDGILDGSGYNITGIEPSLSGEYHIGQHPDWRLREKAGGDVPILVVDDIEVGRYETVWPDIDRDGWFGNETPMRPGAETSGRDNDGDGLWDISAGLVYWVSDGVHGVPYGSTYSSRHGYLDRIAGPGNLTLFMLESGSHGTLCASAVSAQGVVDGGRVLGMAPNATITSIGNHYSGGHSLDAWRFIAEGYDGDPATPDQPHIGSFSFGYSSVDDSGADGYSLYLDWITRVYNSNVSYAVAIGNGGHGFGTTKVPGAAHGVFSVGAFSSRSSDSWGQSAPWSNRGPNAVGRMDPDIVAVGWSATGDMPLNNYNNANQAWTTWGGTSLATPVVAGLLALVEQAWLENYGTHPGSQELRDFVLSTSDDRGYEPFVQGGGWMNASRSVRTLQGFNGTWSASPAQWNTGWFHGHHRDANLNSINPGQEQQFDILFNNPAHSELGLNLTPITFQPLEHTVLVWNSTGNGSGGGENETWDGHQGDRPDLLIPIHISNETENTLHPETVQFRARATIQHEAFDQDMDRSSNERVYLEIFRWTDFDGDGSYHNDTDLDGMVDESEWEDGDELEEITFWWSHGPQAEVRLGMPFEDARDGLLLGVWRYDGTPSGLDEVRIEVDWTSFGVTEDDWISVPENITLPPNSETNLQVAVAVPEDASPGLRQHGIRVVSENDSETNSTRSWTLPIVTNVPWRGPFTLSPNPLDGNVSNQTLYTESWISGAMRWSWRPESGDWRFLTVDWPDELSGDGAIILDVDWLDNPFTDIDVLWMTEKPHEYWSDDPQSYGPTTFYIEERSVNNHAGSGQHNWGTYTGTSRETFVVPSTPGIHQMVLHTALHGVETNDNPLNISLGYITAESGGFSKTVSDWSESSGYDDAIVVSTMPLPVSKIESHGWVKPVSLTNQTAFQDDPGDKMTASWWQNISLEDATEVSIKMDSYDDADLDLFLFRDKDGDGNFTSGEEVSRSWSGTSSESISVSNPEDGLYAVAVHGWSVSGGSAGFWIDIEMVAGDSLNVTGFNTMNDSEISETWPSGSEDLAGEVPTGALHLNLSYETPPSEGSWTGFVDIELEGGSLVRIPYNYELVELDPEISFTTPENLTESNTPLPVNLHVRDVGIGFSLAEVSWDWPSNGTRFQADYVWGVDVNGISHNLTSVWNENSNQTSLIPFREVWINSTLPKIEEWFHFHASVYDNSGRQSESHLSILFDSTSPDLAIFGVPWITNSQTLNFSIRTEPGAILTFDGTVLQIDESGISNHSIELQKSRTGIFDGPDGPAFLYDVDSNVFSVESADKAGNRINSSFQVVFDPDPPSEVNFVSIIDQAGYSYGEQELLKPVNLSSGSIQLEITSDTRKWCFSVLYESWVQKFECHESEGPPIIVNQSSHMNQTQIDYDRTSTISIPLELSGLSEGELTMLLSTQDWANNSHESSWKMTMDSMQPVISWGLSPANGILLSDHHQNLSWWSSEEVTMRASINGQDLEVQSGSSGSYEILLTNTGNQVFCLNAIDRTIGQENNNSFNECRNFELQESDYDTSIFDSNPELVALDTIQVVLDRHQSQEIRWYSQTTGENGTINPGERTIVLSLDLVEGTNEFLIEVDSLDSTDSYSIILEKDSIAPVLGLSEKIYRESPLSTTRGILGNCEPGLMVRLTSPIESRDLTCPESGIFEINLSIPREPGLHTIEAFSMDHAKNTNSTEIYLIKQDWVDWALEDATESGPMLVWFSLALLLLVSIVVSVSIRFSNTRR